MNEAERAEAHALALIREAMRLKLLGDRWFAVAVQRFERAEQAREAGDTKRWHHEVRHYARDLTRAVALNEAMGFTVALANKKLVTQA